MTKRHVDYAGSPFPVATLDTGTTAAAAIRPILNGDVATQATFQRPDENLRTRTEIVRTELEQLKYLSDADRTLMMLSSAPLTWNGVAPATPQAGPLGTFTLPAAQTMTVRPFLAPLTSTPAKIINRGLKFQTNLTVAGPINPPRAYGSANKYNVQFVNQTGSPVTVTYDPLLFRFTVNTDTAVRTKTDVINAFNAAATAAGQGITATIDSGFGTDIFASGVTFIQGDPADYMVFAGAADAEKHVITAAGLVTFFSDNNNTLIEGDVLAIGYDTFVNGAFGGRQESLNDAPESAFNVVDNNLFVMRRFPERLPISIPVATVIAGQLLFANGAVCATGIPTTLIGGDADIGGLVSVADITARDAILATTREEGMIVYSLADDRYFVLEGGITNGDWTELGDDGRLVGGMRVVSWTYVNPSLMTAAAAAAAAIPVAKRKTGMPVTTRETATGYIERLIWDGANFVPDTQGDVTNWGVITGCAVSNPSGATVRVAPGQFRCHDGRVVTIYEQVDVTISATNRSVIWDRTDGTIKALVKGAVWFEDFVFADASYSGGYLTRFLPCAPRTLLVMPAPGTAYVGGNTGASGTHFDTHYQALVWRASFGDGRGLFKDFFIPIDASYTVDQVSLPGTVTATSGAGAVVTGTGTRFKRDFSVGDWIKIGSRHAKISVVTDDVTMTVVNMVATVVSATAYSRLAWVGPRSYGIDATKAEINTLTGLNFFGAWHRSDPTIGEVRWAPALSGDTITECKAMVVGSSSCANWRFRNIALNYGGEVNVLTDHSIAIIQNPGKNWSLRDVHIDGVDTLTHALSIDSDIGELELDGVVIKDMSLSTAIYGGASGAGRVTVRRSTISCPTTGKLIAPFSGNPSNTLDVLFDDCTLDDIDQAIFVQNMAGDWPMQRTVRHCRIGYDGGGINAIAIRSDVDLSDGSRVIIDDCEFINASTAVLTGTRVIGNSRSSGGGTVVDNASSRHLGNELKDINYDFATLAGVNFKSTLGNVEVERAHAQFVSGLLGGSGTVKGYANRDIECHPGRTAGPTAVVELPDPGYVVPVSFPDGRIALWTWSSVNLRTIHGGGSALDRLTGAAAVDDTIYYFFLRKGVAGFTVDDLAFSSSPPQANGALALADTVEGGRARTDYMYIGSLMTGDIGSAAPWAGCRAVHYGNGLRRVWISRITGVHADLQASDTTINGSGLSGSLTLPNLNTRLPTAREIGIQRRLTLATVGGGTLAGAYIHLNSPSGNRPVQLTAQVNLTQEAGLYDDVIVPRENAAAGDYAFVWQTHGALQTRAYVELTVTSWLENLNFIIPHDPPVHDG